MYIINWVILLENTFFPKLAPTFNILSLYEAFTFLKRQVVSLNFYVKCVCVCTLISYQVYIREIEEH